MEIPGRGAILMRRYGRAMRTEYIAENLAEDKWFRLDEDGRAVECPPHLRCDPEIFVSDNQAWFFIRKHDLGGRPVPVPNAVMKPASLAYEQKLVDEWARGKGK